MICKIQPPNPNIRSAIEYNEKKMDGIAGIREHETDASVEAIENGHVLATRNVPDGATLLGEFDRLKLLNLKTATRGTVKNPTFHMSVNPSASDRPLTEAQAVRLIDEIMEGLGYAGQPYRIYQHTDIARMHYHVVACRIGQDGKKVDDSFERLTLRKRLRELAPRYGFEMILNDEEKRAEGITETEAGTLVDGQLLIPPAEGEDRKKKEDKNKKDYVPAFSRKSDMPVTEQFTDIFEDSLKWSFTTFEQLQALMLRRYNVMIEIERGEEGADRIVMSGTDSKGTPITPPVTETELGLDMSRRIRERCESSDMRHRRQQKARLEALAQAAADAASSYEEFVELMAKKGVITVISWTKDGEPFGVTWLDRATKCAWKGSETARTLLWLRQTTAEKGWTVTMDKYDKTATAQRRAAMPSRKPTMDIPRHRTTDSSGRQLESALRKGAHGQGSGESAARGKKRDIFDEIEEQKEREEKNANAVE